MVPIEAVFVPFPSWERVPKKIRGGVKLMLRKPFRCCCGLCGSFDVGKFLIMRKNLMLESMPERVQRASFVKTGPEMAHYRRPFAHGPESRRPVLSFVRSIPVAGEPAEVLRGFFGQ